MYRFIIFVLSVAICATQAYGRIQTPAGSATPAISISITNPTNGATVSGLITVSAAIPGDQARREVRFYVDGVDIGSPDEVAPYAVSRNTPWSSNGPHTITATATGLVAAAEALVVNVRN